GRTIDSESIYPRSNRGWATIDTVQKTVSIIYNYSKTIMVEPHETPTKIGREFGGLGTFLEPVKLIERRRFVELFGRPSSNLGEGSFAEVGKSKLEDLVLKNFLVSNQGIWHGLTEAIAISRLSLYDKRLIPKGMKDFDGATPVALDYWNGFKQGLAIEVPKKNGVSIRKYIQQNSGMPERFLKQLKTNVTKAAIEELTRKLAMGHRKGIANRDVKVDGCLISTVGDLHANFVDYSSSFMVPELSRMIKAIKMIDEKNQQKQIKVYVPLMNSSEADEFLNNIARTLGFTDKNLSVLLGAESLDGTYLDDTIWNILKAKMLRTSLNWISQAPGEPLNFLKDWYRMFQETCDMDWDQLTKIIEEKLKLLPVFSNGNNYKVLIEKRKKLTNMIDKSQNVLELTGQISQIDDDIYRTITASLEQDIT
ncbi:MAG: hypothetical protein AAB569_00415, partial [Patescibacteria group bacterium]